MAFTIAQAGTSFHILDDDGTIYTTLVLPTGVVVDPDQRAQFLTLAGKLIITRAPSVNLWVNPEDFSVRPLAVLPPVAPPVIAAGSGTGLTGTYYGAYSYIVIINGVVVQESPLSPISLPVTLTNDDVDWSNLIPSTEAHVNGYRLYRTVTDGSPAVLFEAQQGGGASTVFTGDATPDAGLSLLPAPDTGNAPGGTIPGTRLSVAIAWRDRLWAVSSDPSLRDVVCYTEAGSPFVWTAANQLLATVKGEDEWGVTGFLARRDELVVGRRQRFLKILGSSNDNFEMLVLAEGPGCAAPDSCLTIGDIGYCRGLSAVYAIGPEGVRDITTGKVGTWFHTGVLFNRADANVIRSMGSYNPETDSYELHMVTGENSSEAFTVWMAYSRRLDEWVGPGFTGAFTPTARGTRRNDSGELIPVMGSSDGYVYDMNESAPYDLSGSSPGTTYGIVVDWRSKPYTGQTPDGFHVWGRITVHQRAQGSLAGSVDDEVKVYMFVGDVREQGQNMVNTTALVRMPLTRTRVELPRPGAGQSLQFYFRHNFVDDPNTGALIGIGTSVFDFELWGIEIPVTMVGRR